MRHLALVDVYPIRLIGNTMEFLVLRRADAAIRAGSWEAVHGHVDPGEHPVAAARRELMEEIGCTPRALYNLSRVEQFYLHASNEFALIPVFVAVLADDAVITLSDEHDAIAWLPLAAAQSRCTWPRAARAMEDAVKLLATGDAGVVEGVLRVE